MDRWEPTLERLPPNRHDIIFDDPRMVVRVKSFKSEGVEDDDEVYSLIQRADQNGNRRAAVEVEGHMIVMVTCLGYRQLPEGTALVWDCIPFGIGLIDISMAHKLPEIDKRAENRVIYHKDISIEPFILEIGYHFDEAGMDIPDILCAVQVVLHASERCTVVTGDGEGPYVVECIGWQRLDESYNPYLVEHPVLTNEVSVWTLQRITSSPAQSSSSDDEIATAATVLEENILKKSTSPSDIDGIVNAIEAAGTETTQLDKRVCDITLVGKRQSKPPPPPILVGGKSKAQRQDEARKERLLTHEQRTKRTLQRLNK